MAEQNKRNEDFKGLATDVAAKTDSILGAAKCPIYPKARSPWCQHCATYECVHCGRSPELQQIAIRDIRVAIRSLESAAAFDTCGEHEKCRVAQGDARYRLVFLLDWLTTFSQPAALTASTDPPSERPANPKGEM